MNKVRKKYFLVLCSVAFLFFLQGCSETVESGSAVEQKNTQVQGLKADKKNKSEPSTAASKPKAASKGIVVLPPSTEYQELMVEGWKVMVSPNVKSDSTLYQPMLDQLAEDLKRLKEVVPAHSLPYLQKTAIWLEQGMPTKKLKRTFFNGSRKLTKKHALVPESYGGIIIGNTKGYLAVAGFKKWQMLHELTHAYHQFQLKHSYEPIVSAFANTKKLNLHDPKFDKKVSGSGYPTRNKKEYLAELTVAYFGSKHSYPQNRKELAEYDSQGYCAIVKAWGLVGKQDSDAPLRCG